MDIVQVEKMEDQITQVIDKSKITFAYIHVDYGNEPINQSLKYFQRSIAHVYPNESFVTINIINPFTEFMRARTVCYTRMRKQNTGNMIHLDVDIIAYRKLPLQFWDQDFDIALTTGQHKYSIMPYSEGIIFSKDTPGAHKFFEDYAGFVKNVPEGLIDGPRADWWLGQIALNMAYLKSAASKEVKFLILDDKEFNFTPNAPVATNAYFVHFKGDRKHLMRQYLAGLLGTDYIP